MRNYTPIYVIVGLIMLANLGSATTHETIQHVKIIDKQAQTIISSDKNGMSTKIRYLIITDQETFICESSVLNGKFNNSDIYFHVQKDSTYTLKVCGYGKGMLFDYRNILEAQKE